MASSATSSSASSGNFIDAQVGYSTENGGTTGGAGGAEVIVTTGTEFNAALCNRTTKTTPIIIKVNGTINHGNTTKQSGQCDTVADAIQLKGVQNVSIIGVGSNAVFDQIGIHIRDAKNIIIRNVHVKNVKKSGSPTSNGGDAIGMETDVSNVWVDHCTLEASGGESDGYDALFDMKDTTKYVTLSWTILTGSDRGGLVGSSDSDDQNGPVTYHHNYYKNLHSRMPLLRWATAHSFNNYYDGIIESGMNPRMNGKIKAENNYFTNAKNPIGTFYTDVMGYWDVAGNIFGANVTWLADATNKEYPAGPDVKSTTSITIPYAYTLDDAANVPDLIKNGAGAGKMPDGASSSSASSGGAASSVAASSAAASSSAASSDASSSTAASSSASGGSATTITYPWSDDFSLATTATLFTTGYAKFTNDAGTEVSMYAKTGGSPTVSGGVITLAGARFTIGALGTGTTTGPTGSPANYTPGGIFNIIGKTCTLTINASQAGTGSTFQVYVDNNTTSTGNSPHATSTLSSTGTTTTKNTSVVVSVAATSIVAGDNTFTWKLDNASYTGGSFLQIRTDSSSAVYINSISLSCL
ncbi:polysaccharide lyase family 1 protein [Uliginosibacterium sp. TH139]|uniref:pectate lyase family protein n=1 Tax=Uliginosibacterium sp. TH139 TaxID=2067453 RepID=UPI000C7D094D|nr:pectate trisaccharide-lyase [Uliginosibacterium sp. TH139]PLK47402.1 pectate trisaccharide-lyase [Uliginosibacterium sp. TH139]